MTEPESPNSLEKTGCDDQTVTSDQAATTYTCAATSDGGTTAVTSVTIKRDATAPTLAGAATTLADAAGWYNGNVTVHWTASDALSGLDGPRRRPERITTRRRSLRVRHGRRQGGQRPRRRSAHQDRPHRPHHDGRHVRTARSGWYTGDVNVTLHGTDTLSGVAKTYDKVDGGAAQEYTDTFSHGLNGTAHISYWSVDNAGNAEEANSIKVKIDGVKPTIEGSRTPAANDFGWNNSDVVVSFARTPTPASQTGTPAARSPRRSRE